MLNNVGDIDVRELIIGETTTIHVSTKSLEGKLYLDARKWIKYPDYDNHIATKKGLMLSIDDWRALIPKINELLESNK